MSVNKPPYPNVNTFNNLYWLSGSESLTTADADLRYLKWPSAQGTENLQTTNVNGLLTANSNMTVKNTIIVNNAPIDTNVTTVASNNIVLTDGTTSNTIDKNGYTTRNTTANLTHYLNFSDNSATGTGSIQKNANLSCNPSTGIIAANSYTINSTPSTANIASRFGQVGLVYLQTLTGTINGSATTTNFNLASIFNSTYPNYRIVISSAQVSFTAYPSYSLAGILGSGAPSPGSANLYGFEMTSNSPSVVTPLISTNVTLSTTPLIFSVTGITNKQVVFDVFNVGFASTSSNQISLMCKSIYNNPGVNGISDRTITAISSAGNTITGLTIQQTSIGVGNNMTWSAIIYGYNLI